MARPKSARTVPALAEYRRRRDLTQEQVAERLGLSVEMIRRHERGDARPGEPFRRGYARLYGATLSELGLAVEVATGFVAPSEPAVLPMPVAMQPGDRIGPATLVEIHRHMRQLVALDNQFGGTDLTNVAGRFFRSLTRQLGAGMFEPAIRKDLLAAVGELAEITGWLAYDAGRHKLVRQMNQESLYYSGLVGDTTVELLTVQNASMHAGYLDRPFEALQLAESVLEGRYRLSPRVRCLFLVRKARALAQGGDDAAFRVLDEAMTLYGDGVSPTDPPWAWWVDQRELWWHEAMCRKDLADMTGALDAFERSAEAVPDGETRSRFVHRAHLAQAQVRARSWDAAGQTLAELSPLAIQVASGRTGVLISSTVADLRSQGLRVPAELLASAVALNDSMADDLGPV